MRFCRPSQLSSLVDLPWVLRPLVTSAMSGDVMNHKEFVLVAGDYVVVLEAMVQDGYGTATQPAGTAAGDLIRFHLVD